MKTACYLFFLLFLVNTGFAQDLDIYSKKKNTNFELPALNSQSSFEEFQLLSRTLRLQDMAFAALVPGYVHFKVKDPVVGYTLVGLRSIGYGGLVYVLKDNTYAFTDLINNTPPDNTSNNSDFKQKKDITYISLAIIVSTYIFDWIHGKHRLEKKQELIRYKYGLKLNLSYNTSTFDKKMAFPAIGLRYSF
jgi:hypothetical protein